MALQVMVTFIIFDVSFVHTCFSRQQDVNNIKFPFYLSQKQILKTIINPKISFLFLPFILTNQGFSIINSKIYCLSLFIPHLPSSVTKFLSKET